MGTQQLIAKDVINTSWFDEYDKFRKVIHYELIELNISIFIVKKIANFPFKLLGVAQSTFWILTKVALIEKSVITITRLIVDQDSFIRKFKGKVMQNITDSDAKQQLQDAIRKIKFESRVDAVKPAFAYARNNHLAHLDVENNLTSSRQSPSPSIGVDDVDEALSIAIELFNLLCFENGFYLWQIDYVEARRSSETTDIDILLHELAQGSHILHMPENNPEMWAQRKAKYSAVKLPSSTSIATNSV